MTLPKNRPKVEPWVCFLKSAFLPFLLGEGGDQSGVAVLNMLVHGIVDCLGIPRKEGENDLFMLLNGIMCKVDAIGLELVKPSQTRRMNVQLIEKRLHVGVLKMSAIQIVDLKVGCNILVVIIRLALELVEIYEAVRQLLLGDIGSGFSCGEGFERKTAFP